MSWLLITVVCDRVRYVNHLCLLGRLHKTFLRLDAGASESQGGRRRKFGCIKIAPSQIVVQICDHKIDVANVCDVALSFTFSLETRVIFYKSK